MYAESFPMKPKNPAQYKEIIRDTATKAEQRIRQMIEYDDTTTITIHKLEKLLKQVKELETSGRLPDNTPDDMRKYFKSD
jgi:hypothetical protein